MKVIFNNTKVKFDIKFHLEGILTIGKQYNVMMLNMELLIHIHTLFYVMM
jgi:hypothetical protein